MDQMHEKPARWKSDNWVKWAQKSPSMSVAVSALQNASPTTLSRDMVVCLYQKAADNQTPERNLAFLSAMVWGYSSDEDGRADNRGPSRVYEMFGHLEDVPGAREVLWTGSELHTLEGVGSAYEALLEAKITKLGPSFFTKHLYFRGKAACPSRYPVILDARVATGIAGIKRLDARIHECVNVEPQKTAKAYMAYVSYVWEQADKLQVEPDQFELELFRLGKAATGA